MLISLDLFDLKTLKSNTNGISIEEVNCKTIGTGAVGFTHEELIGESHLLLGFDQSVVRYGCKLKPKVIDSIGH